ncbi:MAG TPA: universal stress protein [Candidatus Methylomirabilis sp.]|nr:universal stress protein [Candidatus Methylomirabilis sp.]
MTVSIVTPGLSYGEVTTMEKTAGLVHADKLVKFTNILVGMDFSQASERALEYALSLARRYDARVILAHVITTRTDAMLAPEIAANTRESAFSAAQEAMGQILISGRLRGVPHEMAVEEGALWPALETLITRYSVDLVVVGTHNLGGLKKVFLGSGAEQIFRQANCPVLTVGPSVEGAAPKEGEFKHILFATDFGIGAEREAAYAFSLAQEHEANVTLLHVVSRVEDYSEPGLAMKTEAISHQLAELVPPGSELWCKPQVRMQIGEPVREILEVAKDVKADLLVIGAKRQKGLAAGHALHAVAYRLAGAAPCPVLTVRS